MIWTIIALLIAGLIALAFGGVASGSSFQLPTTKVVVANLDRPDAQAGVDAGQLLVDLLHSEQLASFLQVADAPDAAAARSAVEREEAAVAVIIPAGFTRAALGDGSSSAVAVVRDPVQTIGPAIVQELVTQFVDGFAGAQVAVSVASDQLKSHGVELDATTRGEIARRYAEWASAVGASRGAGEHPALDMRAPAGSAQPGNAIAVLMGSILAGQLIFFTFFTAAYTAESIIREDEEGTLARQFTTPTSRAQILAGNFLAVVLMLIVQVAVLIVAGRLIFSVRWGQPGAVVLVLAGLIVAAAGFGIMVMSFLKDTRQTGLVLGGVLTLVGMLGGLFTVGVPNMPAAFQTVTLFTPHGWALRGLRALLAGGTLVDVWLPAAVTAGMGIVCFAIGLWSFRRRFA